jgi:hypothetical protein
MSPKRAMTVAMGVCTLHAAIGFFLLMGKFGAAERLYMDVAFAQLVIIVVVLVSDHCFFCLLG